MSPEAIAYVCHEANRALQAEQNAPGIPVAVPWEDFPADEQDSVIAGVEAALRGASPEELHESWVQSKLDAGWRYGEVKDAAAKTHPCLRTYADLPAEQRAKDGLFSAIVAALA